MADTQILQQILSEIQGVKSDVTEIKSDISGINARMDSLDEIIRHNGVLLEALDSKVQLIYENQVSIIDHDKRQDDFESTLDEHGTRLFAVEQAIKVG